MKIEDKPSFAIQWAYLIETGEAVSFMIQKLYTTYTTPHVYGVAISRVTDNPTAYASSKNFLLFIINTNNALNNGCSFINVLKIETRVESFRRALGIVADAETVSIFFTESNSIGPMFVMKGSKGLERYNLPLGNL